jgi:hypothetical protein
MGATMSRLFYGEVIDGKIKFDDPDDWQQVYKQYSGQAVEISIRFLGERRNGKQNRFYWKVVVSGLSKHFGYTNDEMHRALKVKFDVPSTSKLSVKEFSEYIADIVRWAEIEQGFLFPTTPHESS